MPIYKAGYVVLLGGKQAVYKEWKGDKVVRYRCHCCGYYTLIEDSDDICPVCWWQDDIVQREDPDYGGGPNHGISLNRAKENFKMFSVFNIEYKKEVRQPLPEELPENNH